MDNIYTKYTKFYIMQLYILYELIILFHRKTLFTTFFKYYFHRVVIFISLITIIDFNFI